AASGRDRDLHLAANLYRGDDVRDRARDDHAQWVDLIDAGVGAVELARGEIETDFALKVLAQMPPQGVALHVGEIGHERIVLHRAEADNPERFNGNPPRRRGTEKTTKNTK